MDLRRVCGIVAALLTAPAAAAQAPYTGGATTIAVISRATGINNFVDIEPAGPSAAFRVHDRQHIRRQGTIITVGIVTLIPRSTSVGAIVGGTDAYDLPRGEATLSAFHLASANKDENQDGLDQVGGAVWTAADLAEDLPALEVGVGPLARAALAGVGGVDLALVA